ncbi:PilT/PilU family type 4a pilus ATPase [Cocleimonas flava]|jgi:twitching motility protein PilU|uniref:Twitching motility protein PilU n=1 Tax=Cocleimonas flava TaxID=634765 RepID=A0A4V2P9E6_9GAMM|nr:MULTISPECIES: PilT/PilU family type 4a pilus ATPase [Cocleimonas]MEB8431613.1 PilT/PilU family type 4a pilus ATPase [Cocleimonas sp. KMM 6892]MEC4713615.1 PilT/PilU family type 4a pilus ATPase [Cocleimonas sp. KMM 6895]MEC4742946.1 PilT/PilU family type 4a pilus ATPase [Cocleimonas sp. KMM 6896]TCJ89295.1 twitching motility protein PilU [Cocleimonas flava]
MKLIPYLELMVKREASDLYLTTGAFASIKVMGSLESISKNKLMPGVIAAFAKELLSDKEWAVFHRTKEMNKGVSVRDLGRFRVNVYFQRGEVSMVIRYVRSDILAPEALGLPEVLKDLVMKKEGLFLFVGSTGAGKSTSMSSLIQYRNQRASGHILTIEDPIEFTYRHDKSIIGQREVGFDTHSYENAMREAMREAPDVIMVGEIRSTATVEAAMGFADTGHLVISTLHATNSIQALERLIYLLPADQKDRVLMDLSLNLNAIIAQRLIPSLDGRYALATEVLVNSPFSAEVIRKGRMQELKDIIEKGGADGMHTFDQSLAELFKAGKISRENALEHASSKNNLEWMLSFDGKAEEQNERSINSKPVLSGALPEIS